MKNIFLFIRRYLTFLSFLLLQVAAIVMLSNSSKTHQSFFASAANEVTGNINKRYSGFRDYFSLKETNRLLAEENARLRNMLQSNFSAPDQSRQVFVDTLVKDTLGRSRKFTWLPAKVVGNSYTLQNNFITIERGSDQGVTKGMAAVSSTGIVGVVVETSANFSKIMSLIHRNSKVSAMLKKDESAGSIEWDGTDPGYLTLRNVTKGAKVAKGDTVVTSNYSANFPSKLMIGTVAEISSESSSNFYNLKIKTATNFFSLQYVYLVANVRYAEQVQLENNTPKTP
ncbi:MAG: rod shape-determining protein MreC [Chitinophagaceae bacterium]|nr:rod shape-determining protein MreC [Chitinophagaceae bacterium]MCA6452460.1 rod shape-determining protein MreC [Chitinophagaceae bacterium]MCA6456226.1 rod shape-determining protein MreC [Chitinophagaceae bacterium]MCA6458651.1 rod shape-determining protein MreC [Chitinophagaceae bacterium]MCA6466070.1 rod shape-determining protein MreC [Chitinophagaceae bacterium]